MNLMNTGRAAGHFLAAHWRWRTLDPPALAAFQDRRARRIVAYAQGHSPFYRRHWLGCDLRDWRTLPTVDKAAMMANFDAFNTHAVTKQAAFDVALLAEQTRDFAPTLHGQTVGLSSGTSGHRGIFLVSPQEQAAWAGMILARALHDLPRSQVRVAFFLRSHSNLYAEVNSALLHLHYFDLMTPLAESVAILNHYQPHIVIGPPSLLRMLADAQDASLLYIHPQRLISVAEVLEPNDEKRLNGCFGVPVHQVYQCTEGLLAVSCPHGSLHIQEDIVAIQCEPLPSAADGAQRVTPVVTDLWRRSQPIIRYRLNDVLQMDERPCRCGSCFRTLARIEGRCDDICYFLEPNGNRRPFFPDTIRRMVLLAEAGIADYQAVQERDGQLNVQILLLPGADAAAARQIVAASVRDTVRSYNCLAPSVEIETNLPVTPAGQKRRRVQRIAPI